MPGPHRAGHIISHNIPVRPVEELDIFVLRHELAIPVARGAVRIPEGNAERLAYYEARKLNHLPNSLLDYHDVIHGRETPAERRAREKSALGRPR